MNRKVKKQMATETEEAKVEFSTFAAPMLDEVGALVERAESIPAPVNALSERVLSLSQWRDALSDEDAQSVAEVTDALDTLGAFVNAHGVDWAEGTRKFDAIAGLFKSFPDMVNDADKGAHAALLYRWADVVPAPESTTRKTGPRGPRGTSTTYRNLSDVWQDGHRYCRMKCPVCGVVKYTTKEYLNSARDQMVTHMRDEHQVEMGATGNPDAHRNLTNALGQIGFADEDSVKVGNEQRVVAEGWVIYRD